MWGWLLSGVNEGPSLQDSNGIWLKVRLHPCQGLYWYTGAREERGGGIQQGITLWGASSRPWQTGRHKMGGGEFTVLNAGSKFHISTKKFWNIQCFCIYSFVLRSTSDSSGKLFPATYLDTLKQAHNQWLTLKLVRISLWVTKHHPTDVQCAQPWHCSHLYISFLVQYTIQWPAMLTHCQNPATTVCKQTNTY